MTLRFRTFGILLLAGCVGASMTQSLSAPSASPAPDAYACVREQIKAVGFTQASYDTDALRVTARKFNENVRRPDVMFRRLVDRLEIEVAPGGANEVSRISIEAKTFAELATQRGPTEEQERTSETAQAAARAILEKCGGEPAPADSVVPPAQQD